MLTYDKKSIVSNSTRQLPWVEKYRPKQINNIISHQEIIQSLKKCISMNVLPHLLFFGPSGTGKTSTIICCANEIYGEKYADCMILQLNASNERGIETVRTKIKEFVSNKNSIFLPPEMKEKGVFKLVILDEIDAMTIEAQAMLRQTIEKNSVTTRFCLLCNDIDKIHIALQSRCTLYRFAPLNPIDMKSRLEDICEIERIKYDDDALDAIIKISKGDMRSAINILQHVDLSVKSVITSDNVYQISGHCLPYIIKKIYHNLIKLSKKKIDLQRCVENISDIILDNNVTIFNLLDELKNLVIDSKLKTKQKIFLIENFAYNEIYDSANVDSKNIFMILASLFLLVANIN